VYKLAFINKFDTLSLTLSLSLPLSLSLFPLQGIHMIIISHTSHLHALTSIELPRDDFWCGIVRTTTAGAQELSILHQVAQSKVGYLDLILRV
jgi:hypothetical protein